MKAPSKVPPYYNLKNTMDLGCWISVPVSLISVSLALVIIVRVGKSYGIPQPDLLRIILTPFAMMNHEEMPAWFEFPHLPVNRNRSLVVFQTTTRLVRRGRAGNLLLLMWSYMGMIIMFGFTCNLRSIYMQENYETPLDTAEQIYKSNKTFYYMCDISQAVCDGVNWLPERVQESFNKTWFTKLAIEGEKVSTEEWYKLQEKMYRDDNIVLVETSMGKTPVDGLHRSKELINSIMGGWELKRMSPWQESLDAHILQLDQVFN